MSNLLKRFYERVTDKVEEIQVQPTCAAIVEPDERNEDELLLFTDRQNETYRDDVISPDISDEQQMDIKRLLYEYQDIFTDVPKVTHLGEHIIEVTSTATISGKVYTLPHAMREVVDKELNMVESLGITEPSTVNSRLCFAHCHGQKSCWE